MDIKLVPGTGIRMSTSGFYLKLTGDWKCKAKEIVHISGKGSVKFKMTVDLSITSTSEMGKDHLPTVSVVDCQFRVRGVDIDFRGGASWLYNLFTGFIEKPIKKNLEGQACPRITQMLNKSGQKVMDKMKLLLDIGNDMQLDLRLVASPVFGVSYMQSPHKGCFMFQGMSPSAFSPAPLDASEDLTSRMLYMFITEAMLNSGSAAYWQSGQLKLTIKPSIVPPNQFFNLDTNSIGILLPGSTLSSKYPNMEMLLNVSVPTAPKFDVSTDHVLSIIPAEVMAFVIQPDSSPIHVFTLEVTLNTTLSLWVENVKGRLHVGLSKNITVFHGDVTVKESNVGQSSGEKIEQLLNLAMPFLLAGIENKGFPLPTTPGLTFIRPEIRVVKGSIIIGTDINSQLP
jgi:lipopolysaccharide-binding protein